MNYTPLPSPLEINQLITLGDIPGQIFNVDESGVPLNPSLPKIISQCGSKKISIFTSNGKTQMTVVACVGALGVCLPPMTIFPELLPW